MTTPHLCTTCGCMCAVAQRTNREMVSYIKAVIEIEALIKDHPERFDPWIAAIIAAARATEEEAFREPLR